MRNVITLLLFCFVFWAGCNSQQTEKKVLGHKKVILFKPELTIGQYTKTKDVWFGRLTSFSVAPDGNIYCLDGEYRKIKVFDKMGKPIFSFGGKGKGPGEFIYPTVICASKNGFIYVLDAGQRAISKFTMGGEFLGLINIKEAVARFEIFESGNLVLEVANINMKDIKQSQHELRLFDSDLNEIKSPIYKKTGSHLTWVESAPGKRFTLKIPFAPEIEWKIIGDRLYVGYSEEYKIFVYNSNGEFVKEIRKNLEREQVSEVEIEKWKKDILQRFKNRPQFVPQMLKKSLNRIAFPHLKPAFMHLTEISKGLVVFRYHTEDGTLGIVYNKNDNEIGEMIFEYDDFKYFFGKYYRITGGIDNPYTLIRYNIVEKE
ncbi:6-bladed beta-propeller [Calditrichota bacterium LG25]